MILSRAKPVMGTLLVALMLAGCAGRAVELGSRVSGPVPVGPSREISATGCGFQLMLLIPIALNSRLERAYNALKVQAGTDMITDVQVEERWTYGFVGTSYCTTLKARAVSRAAARPLTSPAAIPGPVAPPRTASVPAPAPAIPAPAPVIQVQPGPQTLRKAGVIRGRPTRSGEFVEQLPLGSTVQVLRVLSNDDGVWAYVKSPTEQGWLETSVFSP